MRELPMVRSDGIAEIRGLRMLWAAVLLRAMEDAAGHVILASGAEVPHIMASARRWLRGESRRPGSFVWVCEMFDLDPEKVRTLCAAYSPAWGPRTPIKPVGLGARGRAYRNSRGWTMARLAERLEVSPSTIFNIESGRHRKIRGRCEEQLQEMMRRCPPAEGAAT